MKLTIRRTFLCSVILFMLMGILFIPYHTALVFYVENTSEIAAYLPLDKEDTFQIIFTHSIHLTDVVEKYIVTDNLEIMQYEMIYEEFGIGMPSNAEEGQTYVYEDGKHHIKDVDTIFPFMNIRNGKTVSEHRLVWGENAEHIVWFNQYFVPGAWFKVKATKLSLWELMEGVKIHD
ncbi:DUF1850 domain-containing protein [Oceanobacillus chungangensis]|uniref:DUF1850 domain-containing protein n=1 Tax=Oceanobacillus chungangensis TaxID=1229152 RepID=A0A3D8PWP9_9BACI|nr:DUF1850 domain-containing protein [Oceanobacillus chungangensis]RDW20454.1 DUF1850 domain-containing protein [Oceanobacillus chungangensis]